jgi:glycosyltransferase involved in cell wall biosynthesis
MKVACIIRSSVFDVRGGDTTQFTKTTEELKKLGVDCDVFKASDRIEYGNYDLLHLFNIIRPADHLKHIQKSHKPFVISTIYLDYSDFDRYGRNIPQRAVLSMLGKSRSEYLKNILRYGRRQDKLVSPAYLFGHLRAMREIVSNAALLLPNSHSEYNRLKRDTGIEKDYMVVPNGIDESFFKPVERGKKREKKVVSVGQVYGRKNQHRLIMACRKLKVPLDIIGKSPPNHKKYFEYCRELSGNGIRIVGYVPKEELYQAYQSAWVHALPSWFETTGLSSLEAGAMGCNLVVGTGGDTREYFEGHASFCDAADQQSIEKAVEEALSKPLSLDFREIILEHYTWKRAAEKTLEAYEKALKI